MLLERLETAAQALPDRTAIISEQRRIGHGELAAKARAAAHALDDATLAQATLGLCIAHPIDFMVAYFAAAGAGRRIVLLDPRLKPEELRALTQVCEVTHLLYAQSEATVNARQGMAPAHASTLDEVLAVAPLKADWLGDGSARYQDGDFVIHTSSGSTGKPKGIVCTQEQIWHRIVSWIETVELTERDVVLCTLTLSHCHGIDTLMLPPLFVGAQVVAPELARISPRRIVSLWDEHQVTLFNSLPYMYELILDSVPASRVKLASLRYIISASAPLSDATATRFRETYGRWLNQAYGMSEIGPILLVKQPDGTLGSSGDFVAGVEGKLVATPGQAFAELAIRGKGMARGYFNLPQAQAQMFQDGWLWTQDLVAPDRHGYAIKGRKSRFINVGGNKVDPTEVEQACATHPRVQDVAVVGVEDKLFGERIVAVIKAAGDAPDTASVHAHLAAHLASHKLPARYLFVDEIPRTGLGKVQLDVVRQLAARAEVAG